MSTHRTGSYEYNTICDVCGFKFKASELKQRWDGPMVCKDDWEPRNILDFYRTRNDVHKLPFVRVDNQIELTWTPIFQNLSGSIASSSGTFKLTNSTTLNFWVEIIPVAGQSTTAASAEVSLPIEVFSGGTLRAVDSTGKLLGTATINPGFTATSIPNWIANRNTIIISGTYGV